MKPELKVCLKQTLPIVLKHPETKPWFFKRLFELSPAIESKLNHPDMDESSGCFLAFLIAQLHGIITDQKLKVEPDRYGHYEKIMPEHFSYVNKALILTVHDILGADFSDLVNRTYSA